MKRGSSRRLKRKPGKTYQTLLKPWAVIRWLSPIQRTVVVRFRSRSDADGHVSILRQLMPHAQFEVIFDLEEV
jgi:hypothetical protein